MDNVRTPFAGAGSIRGIHELEKGRWTARCLGTALTCVAAFLMTTIPSAAMAADGHVLDPALSLSGGTGVTTLDPVADPGSLHPQKPFNDPCGVAVDSFGNIFVANGAFGTQHEEEGELVFDGVIDVFAADGKFITEVPNRKAPCSIAVDSTGRLYVYETSDFRLVRFDPVSYEPQSGVISYGNAPASLATDVAGFGLDPSNDHWYTVHGSENAKFRIDQFLPDDSLAETFTEDDVGDPKAVVVGPNHDLYLPGDQWKPIYDASKGQVSVLDAITHAPKLTLEGFGFTFGRGGVAVDSESGDIYVDDIVQHHWVKHFDASGSEIGQLSLPGNGLKPAETFSSIAVDRGALSPNQGYVFVTSGSLASNSHLYAFAPPSTQPPEVRGLAVRDIGGSEATLVGEVNPRGSPTSYRFEYGPEDCALGDCLSTPVAGGSAGSSGGFVEASAAATGLLPGTSYHFRLVATSHCNASEPSEECVAESADDTFSTFPSVPVVDCPNAALRTGPSAGLADCRAYELVSPSDTGGRIPTAAVFGSGPASAMPVPLVRDDGESLTFGTEGGTVPGSDGSGR
ncbi:MAG TPA: hypothetical protein VJQ84_00475, partial [Solirubrobacterales bacterium]|nr:hypothetical protein [Solirubrobacterales bacterium]